MKQGDKKTVLLHESMAYGTQNTEQIIKKLQITRSDVPGMEGWFRSEDIATGATTEWNNQTITIKQILNDEFVVITYPRQHPFAGKSITLSFKVNVSPPKDNKYFVLSSEDFIRKAEFNATNFEVSIIK